MKWGEGLIVLLMFFCFFEGVGQVLEGEWFAGWIKLGLIMTIYWTWPPLQ